MHVSALHAAVNSRKHLKVDLNRREVLTLMALFTFWQCKIVSPSYNLLLERCVGAKRSTMFSAMKSLEDRGLLIRRSFLDRKDGSRHVAFFLDLPGIFTDECCAELDSDPKAPITTRHTIEMGRTASTEEILAMVTFVDVSQWQEINCKLTSKKSPLGFFDDLSGFLLPCPDNVPVHKEEEPKPDLCVAVSDNQGDLFDMLHEVEIVEDETPSDTLIDVPASQELAIAAPKAPVKAKKSKKRNDYPDDFEEFWRTYPRREDKKKAFTVWQKALKGGATADEIIAGAVRYAKYRAGEPEQYTKHPSTWLNGDCWENEYSTAGMGYGSGQYGSRLSPEEAALNREAIASTFADRLREWGYSSVEEYREHTEGLSRMYREDAEEQRAQELAFLNAF